MRTKNNYTSLVIACIISIIISGSLDAKECYEEIYNGLFETLIKKKTVLIIKAYDNQNLLEYKGSILSYDIVNITIMTVTNNKIKVPIASITEIEGARKRRFNPLSVLAGVGIGLLAALIIMTMTVT